MTVGKVQKYIIKSIDAQDNAVETTLSNKFIINPETEYSAVDTASKSLIALSNDVYSDTSLITDISVNEAKQGGGGGTVDFDIPENNTFVFNNEYNGGSLKCEILKNGADVSVLGYFLQANRNFLKNSNNENIQLATPNVNDTSNSIKVIMPTGYCGANYDTEAFNNTASGYLRIRLRIILTNSQGAIKILENRQFNYTVE